MGTRSDYTVFIGPPGPSLSTGTVKALLALTTSRHTVKFGFSGNGWDDFDHLWVEALNASEAGYITHFAMLHADVMPDANDGEPVWLDTLIEELDRLDLDMVSCLVPMKDFSGLTSSGIGDPSNPWGPYRRFTMREVPNFPETFNAADVGYAGYPLLHNTGCWVADLRRDVFHQVDEEGTSRTYFGFPQRVHRQAMTGRWIVDRESEDWFFSRGLHSLNAKTAITRKVKLTHRGWAGYKNYDTWGTDEHDYKTAQNWAVPRGPWDEIHGWFDFADIYHEQVERMTAMGGHFVEVGSWFGKSAAFMATKIRDAEKLIRFDCVDTWEGGESKCHQRLANKEDVKSLGLDLFAEFNGNMSRLGLSQYVNPVRMPSVEAAALYEDDSLDFVFIDADHGEEWVRADLAAWWPKVQVGGVLAGHDYDEAGPKAAADAFAVEHAIPIVKRCRSFVMVKGAESRLASSVVDHSVRSEASPDPMLGNTAEYQWV